MSIRLSHFLALISLLQSTLSADALQLRSSNHDPVVRYRVLPRGVQPITPFIVGRFDTDIIAECSGIIQSRRFPGIYWTHNDSHDIRFAAENASRRDAWEHDPERARIYPIRVDGSSVMRNQSDKLEGVRIEGVINDDWEDIAIDEQGRIVVGDFGNNRSERQDLMLYIFHEPNPFEDETVSKADAIPIHFPDQKEYPSPTRNFDAEALFCAFGHVYILTKHRGDCFTKLYRLDSYSKSKSNALTLLDQFNINGQVTGADVTDEGRTIAVLTYDSLWLFELTGASDDYFGGNAYWIPLSVAEAEGVSFADRETLLIASESGYVYAVAREDLIPLEAEFMHPEEDFSKKLAMYAEALLNKRVPTDINSSIGKSSLWH